MTNIHTKTYDVLRSVLLGKPVLKYLEVHLTDHCNLNCKGCTHYCNLVDAGANTFADINTFTDDLKALARKLFVKKIRLMGGEPLLHPEVTKFIRAAANVLPDTKRSLVTNGLLLEQMSADFWTALRETDTLLDITKYPPLDKKFDKLLQLVADNGCTCGHNKNAAEFGYFLNTAGTEKRSIRCRDCYNLRDGKIYHCPQACYVDFYNRAYDARLPREAGIDVRTHSGKDIVRYLKKPLDFCVYCVDHGPSFPWQQSTREQCEWVSPDGK